MFPQFSRSLEKGMDYYAGDHNERSLCVFKMALPGQGVAYCWPSTFQKNAADCANWAHVQLRGDTTKPSLTRLSISGTMREGLCPRPCMNVILFFFFCNQSFIIGIDIIFNGNYNYCYNRKDPFARRRKQNF